MKKNLLLASLLLAIGTSQALAADKSKAYATVNGQTIGQNVADAFLSEQKSQGVQDSPQLQAAIKEELVRRALLVQEARKKGLDKLPQIQGAMELATQTILIRAYLSEYLGSNPVSDAQLRKDYDDINATLGKEYRARHILVEKEDEAKAIIAKLDKGEKIADLASVSKDPGSKDKGGDLDWAQAGSYVPPFAEALSKLEKGKYTATPVKTDFGYHVIYLEDVRNPIPPAFEEVKPQLVQRANKLQVDRLINDLRGKAKVN